MKRIARRAGSFWFGPVEALPYRLFEKAFTVTFLAYFFVARFSHWREWLTPEGYHYSAGATPSYLIEPFPLLVPGAAVGLGVVTGIAGILAILRRFQRISFAVLFLVAVYIQNADALSAFALNIHYIVGFAVFVTAPGDTGRDPAPRIGSGWPVRTLQATFLIQLFTAGWCKVQMGDWLHESDVLWSHLQGPYRNHLASWMLLTLPGAIWTAMQWGAFLFELVGPFMIAFPKTRWLGIAWAVGFVGFIAATMSDLQYFSMQLASYLILFIPAEFLRRWGRGLLFPPRLKSIIHRDR